VYAKVKTLTRTHALLKEATLVLFFAALTALGAQVAVRLPFSPVPITLQVLMVIVTGLALGGRRGLAGQVGYVAAGAMGLPVFAGGTGGAAVLFGPTGGYLMAFPAAAFVAGLIGERWKRRNRAGAVAASLAAVAVIYGGGVLWLATWLRVAGAELPGTSLARAWALGVRPFILADLAKAVLAAAVVGGSRRLLDRWFGVGG
jgi:biotin transport system substrate-specific component